MTEFDVLLWPQALEAWRFYWPCLSAHWWLWVLPLFYSSETLYLAAFSAIKHCYCIQCSSVWGVREAYCSLTGSQLLGRFGAELSQHFLFFLHKDSSSLIKHSPSLCLDITNLFFFLFPASWGLFFFVFLCFVLLHLIWGDSFSWNKVSFFCLLLKLVSQQKGSVTEKTQGKVHSADFFVCYERTMGIFDGSPVQVCWDPWRKSLWVLPMPLLPHPSGVTHCDCLHTPPPAAQGAAPAPAPAPVAVSPGSPGLTLPPRIRVMLYFTTFISWRIQRLFWMDKDKNFQALSHTGTEKRMRELVFYCLTSILTLMFIRISGFSESVNFFDIHF